MPTADDNRTLIREYMAAVSCGDLDGAAAFFAEDTRNHGRPVGRAGVRFVLGDIRQTFPDARFEVLETLTDGDWVAARVIFCGTHAGVARLPVNGGMLVGVPATGRAVEVQHIHMLQVRDGRFVEHFANRDDLGMMQQLGLLPTG